MKNEVDRIQSTFLISILYILIQFACTHSALGQAEFTTWGNLTGIRVEGQLMEFETSVCVINKDWSKIIQTAREKQPIRFSREKNKRVFNYVMDSLNATNAIETIEPDLVSIDMECKSSMGADFAGAFFRIDLPARYYTDGTVQLAGESAIKLKAKQLRGKNEYAHASTKNISINSSKRKLEITLREKTEIIIRDDRSLGNNDFQIYIMVVPGGTSIKEIVKKNLLIKAGGEIDRDEIKLTLDTSKPGRPFDGIGGNFRIQNAKTDPLVIDYCLANLRVSYGRVEMPWRFWQPDEGSDPLIEAKSGKLHPRVQSAMEMAQRLSKMGIPIILSCWSAPDWAIQGPYSPRPVNNIWGNPLHAQKAEKIYESIAAYILYLKENYNVEIEAFSFNESDLGINIRQTADEHRQLIKGLGAHLASKGLKTKLLLGDTADVTGWPFANDAAADPETYPYISAVSFHSWRGYSDENLKRWAMLAEQINKPLLVGEGSIDAGAWRYPTIFEEPTYAIDEINLYVRILSICKPQSILQWQLTADYSPLSGGGVFGNNDTTLHPTQRFWNLKQLGSSPAKIFALSITTDKPDVTCAALGDAAKGTYAIHLVNNGATRNVALRGLPDTVKEIKIYTTNQKRGMAEGKSIVVKQGKAQFALEANSFVSLIKTP